MNLYEKYYGVSLSQAKASLEPKIKEELASIVEEYESALLLAIRKCESPIEKLMMMRLIAHEDHFIKEYTSFDPSLQINLFLQKPIEVGNKTYRADFLIKVIALNKPYNFIVECDGHEFHEKTKEQALRDKQRGRSLQKQGYQVIRFTGSEIYRNASTAAAEVFEMIKTMTGLEKEIERIIKEDFEY